MRVGATVVVHHTDVPNADHARAEVELIQGILAVIGRPAAILTLPDRVLPPASAEVREIYRQSAERNPTAAWAAVVAGVMGFAASIATSIAAQVFAHQAVPMRVFRTIPPAVLWLGEVADLGASIAEVQAAAEQLRNSAPGPEVRQVG